MKKKFDFPAFFARRWWYYALWLVLMIFAWEAVFSFLTKPNKKESIYFFCGVENAKTDVMYADFGSIKPEYVKNVDIYACSVRVDAFDSVFITRGRTEGDIFILPDTYCEEKTMQACFYPMDRSFIKELFGDDAECGKALYGEKAYGVKIYDKETDEGKAAEYFTYTYVDQNGKKQAVGDYYLFFNKKSLHLGKLTGGDRDGALKLAQAVFNKRAG